MNKEFIKKYINRKPIKPEEPKVKAGDWCWFMEKNKNVSIGKYYSTQQYQPILGGLRDYIYCRPFR